MGWNSRLLNVSVTSRTQTICRCRWLSFQAFRYEIQISFREGVNQLLFYAEPRCWCFIPGSSVVVSGSKHSGRYNTSQAYTIMRTINCWDHRSFIRKCTVYVSSYLFLFSISIILHGFNYSLTVYRVYANKTQDLISTRKFVLLDFS